MQEFIKYIIEGMLHYINLIFGLLDFKDLGFMWIIIIGIIIAFFVSKDVRKNVLGLFHPSLNVIKTLPGFLFLILFLGYYIYIAIFFEEKITFIVLILSIYLFVQDFFKTNLNLLLESENSIFDSIKDISFPVILLCFQQISTMFENETFNNLNYVLLSLLIIPIYSILFFAMKHYCIYTDFYARYKKYIDIDDYSFFKIFNDSLIECGTYKENEKVLSKFIMDNRKKSYEEMKVKLNQDIRKIISSEKKPIMKKEKNAKYKPSKLFIIFNYIWLFNIVSILVSVLFKRYLNTPFDFWYYWSFGILLICFWYDLMKLKRIENQYDFVIYMFIYIILIVFLLLYNHTLTTFRLTELGFLIPIFIVIRICTYYKKFPNLLTLPFLSKNNFFGLKPEDYKKK